MTQQNFYKRLFLAIELSEDLKKETVKIQRSLQKQKGTRHIKWVQPEKLHLTLRFLGEISTEKLALCLKSIENSLHTIQSFDMTLGPLTILSLHHPRVIALTVFLSSELAYLFQTLEKTLVDNGLPPESRPFLPHITLGRSKKVNLKLEAIEHYSMAQATQPVTEITLFNSEMDTHTSQNVYTAIKRLPLIS